MIWVAKNLYFFNCLLDGAHTTLISSITWPAFYIYCQADIRNPAGDLLDSVKNFLWKQILHTLQADRQCGGIMQKCG